MGKKGFIAKPYSDIFVALSLARLGDNKMNSLDLKSGFVAVTEHGALLEVTLDRPDKLNALSTEMYLDLGRAVDHFRDRDDLHALLIDANGRAFTAGNDIGDFLNADPEARRNGELSAAMQLVHRLLELDKPVLAAVHGNATGIGTTLLLHCDLVIAADSARFYTAFINLGLVPEAGSSLILPGLVGRQNANRLLLAGDSLSADEALRMGLVAYRCGDDELREKALELGGKLAAKPPQAMRYTKQLTRHGADAIREQIKKESVLFGERMFSDETRAIFDKFLNKK